MQNKRQADFYTVAAVHLSFKLTCLGEKHIEYASAVLETKRCQYACLVLRP